MAVCCKFCSFSKPSDSRTYVDADSHVGAPTTYLRVWFRWNANHVKQQLLHLTVKLSDILVKLLDILSQIAVKLFDVIPHVAAFVLDKRCCATKSQSRNADSCCEVHLRSKPLENLLDSIVVQGGGNQMFRHAARTQTVSLFVARRYGRDLQATGIGLPHRSYLHLESKYRLLVVSGVEDPC